MVDMTKNSAPPIRTLNPAGASKANPQAQNAHTAPQQTAQMPPRPSVAAAAAKAPSRPAATVRKAANFSSLPFWAGVGLSGFWIIIVAFAVMQSGGTQTFGGLPLVNWAIGISAVVSPVAMIWMVAAYMQRAADVQSVTEPLRRQLAMIIGESGAAEVRIRRFNHAVREQLELLRSTQSMSKGEFMDVLNRVRQHREELDQFEAHCMHHVKDIQDVIRRSLQHIEQVMDDKFTMLRVLDGKLSQSGETMSRQTGQVHDQVTSLLHEIETNAKTISTSLDRAMQDSRKLADTARAQEASLLGAASTASETLQDLSGKIDINIAHFLEHAGTARQEAERLAGVLDAQTRTLDEFSSTLPIRVSEAESVLHGVADRLYASEQLAREQAINLSDRLSTQIENLDALLEKFGTKFNDMDGSMRQRHTDMDGLAVRISGAANDLAHQLDSTIANLGLRADQSIQKFAAANDDARRSTDAIAQALAETAARYASATHDLGVVSDENRAKLDSINGAIDTQIARFEALHTAADQASVDVQSRASAALQDMQQVLEKLMHTREATEQVSVTLTEKLKASVAVNENSIARINEAARMTIHALGTASEALCQQESALSDQAKASESDIRVSVAELEARTREVEKTMRQQNDAIVALLQDTEQKMETTQMRLATFSADAALPINKAMQQIEDSAASGKEALARYSDGMHDQLHRLQQFNARVGAMGDEVGRITAETLDTIESLNSRFATLRAAQEESTRDALEKIGAVADRLHDGASAINEQSGSVVTNLQQAANDIIRQTQDMNRETDDASARIKLTTATLQTEAEQIRATLQKQADDLGTELSRAEHRFTTLGDTLKQQTDAAYVLLDRVATHYDDVARAAGASMDTQATKLDATAQQSQDKIVALTAALGQHVDLIATGANRMEEQTKMLLDANAKTIADLDTVNARLADTFVTAERGAKESVACLQQAGAAFRQESDTVRATASHAVESLTQVTATYADENLRLVSASQQVEDNLRRLTAATTTLAEQTNDVRTSMDQHNERLLANIHNSMAQMETVGAKMRQTTDGVVASSDQASSRLVSASHELQDIAIRTETSMGALGVSMMQQVASLNAVGEQLSAQNNAVVEAHESQKAQLLAMYDKLGIAHTQASSIAERSISNLESLIAAIQAKLNSIGSSTDDALKNMRDAGADFTEQASMLIQHALQAEQQARTVLTTTASLQEQAQHIGAALRDEGTRTTDVLVQLLEKLGIGNEQLRSVGGDTNAVLGVLSSQIGAQTVALNEAMNQITDRQRTLTSALDAQRETLGTLASRLATLQDETANATERNAARLTEGAAEIANQVEKLDVGARSAAEAVRAATMSIASDATTIGNQAQQAEEQVRKLFMQTATFADQAREVRVNLEGESDRATAALTRVIETLDGGANRVRETGETARSVISSVSDLVAEKTSILATSMHDIGERQTMLNAALDAQRETLGGLVNRVATAQDETVQATERSVARLLDSAEQLSKKMEQVDGKADTSVASILSSTGKLSSEINVMGEQAGKLEVKVREIMASTAAVHDQTKDMGARIEAQTADVLAQVGKVTSQLVTTVDTLKAQSSQVVNSMDQSVLEFNALAKTTGDTLKRQADALTETTLVAEQRVSGVADKMKDHFKLVEDASVLAENHSRILSEVAEKATGDLVNLCTALADSNRDGNEIITTATARLNDTRSALQRELDQIATLSLTATEQVAQASRTLSQQSEALRTNLAKSESALAEAAHLVRDESVQVPAILDRSAAKIEETRKSFKADIDQIGDSMLRTSDRYISTAGAIRDTMADEAKNLATVADAADATLREFNATLVSQLALVQQGVGTLTQEQTVMVEKARDTLAQLETSSQRLAQIRTETLATSDKLASDFETIETRAGSSVQKLAMVGEALAKQIGHITQTTERAEGQMIASSQGFREQLERVRNGVQAQIDDINRGLAQITTQLESTGTTLRTAGASTVADVEKIAAHFDKTSLETAANLSERTQRMRVATDEVGKLLGGFGDQIDSLLSRLAKAGDGIKKNESDLIGRLQQAFGHIGAVADKLESSRTLAANVSDEATRRLREVADTVEKQIRTLVDGSQTVTDIVRNVGQTYTDQSQNVTRNVVDAQAQIISMNKAIEEMQQRTDRMRVTLKLQGEDLIESMGQILNQLGAAGDLMSDTVDSVLQKRAADSLRRMS